jgi:hypothetical protein
VRRDLIYFFNKNNNMKLQAENKMVETKLLNKYFFPKEDKTIEAETFEEALKILKSL